MDVQDVDEKAVPWPRTLAVYADLIFSRDAAGALYSNLAFGEYIAALADRVEQVVVFGRLDAAKRGGEHRLGERLRFVELPFYASVADLPAVWRSIPAARRAFAALADEIDALWAFGPHPVSLALVRQAQRAGVPTMLGVRQDQPRYMRSRLTGWRKPAGVAYFTWLERRYRRLARRVATVVAGGELAQLYGGGPLVLPTAFTLVRENDIVPRADVRELGGGEVCELVAVGRLDPEKNPLLLASVANRLRALAPDLRFRLRIVGDGPLAGELRALVDRLGVGDVVDFVGYVSYGPELRSIYATGDLLLHVSHTEGLPQVLIEAMADGLPIVATDVGGVADLAAPVGVPLVPPDDADAMARRVAHTLGDPALRRDLAAKGLRRAREFTVERQQAVVLEHLAAMRGAK